MAGLYSTQWHALCSIRDRIRLNECAAILASQDIPFRFERVAPDLWSGAYGLRSHSFALWVPRKHYRRAVDELSVYAGEQRERELEADRDRSPFLQGWAPGVVPATAVGLISIWAAIFYVSGPRSLNSIWFQVGRLLPDEVLGGHFERMLTSAYLHADWGHLLGNMGFGGLFAAAVMYGYGPGGGLLAWLLTAGGGMLSSTLWHAGERFSSVGASGGVFGLLGILGAWSFRRAVGFGSTRRRMAAVGATLGIFAWTAVSPQANISGHSGGLLTGILLGLMLLPRSWMLKAWLQGLLGLGWLVLTLAAWQAAL